MVLPLARSSPDEEEVKDEITHDMISENFSNFIKEGKTKTHNYKMNQLETRYINWLKRFAHLNSKRRNKLMTKKKLDKGMLPSVIDDCQAHVRWIKVVSSTSQITCINSRVVLLASGHFFFLHDLDSKRWDQLSSRSFQADGIGLIQGASTENLWAFSEKCQESRVFIVKYPQLQVAYKLRDKLGGKVMGLSFGGNETLFVLKCLMTEHHIVVWCWRTAKLIFTFPCDRSYIHPELFRVCEVNPCFALTGYFQNRLVIQFWNMNFCGSDTVFVNKRSSELPIDCEIHDMLFGDNHFLYLLDSTGNVCEYEKATGKVNSVISWKMYSPVPDSRETTNPLAELLKEYKVGLDEAEIEGRGAESWDGSEAESSVGRSSSPPAGLVIRVPVVQQSPSQPLSPDTTAPPPPPAPPAGLDEFEGEDLPAPPPPPDTPQLSCHMAAFKGGLLISGPDARIRHFSKNSKGSEWTKNWGFIPTDPIRHFIVPRSGDILLGWSEKFGLVRLWKEQDDNVQTKILHYFGGKVRAMSFLHPADSHLLTINSQPLLCVWKKKTGHLVSCVGLPCEMDELLSALDCPLAVLKASGRGDLYGVELKELRTPTVWPPLRLTSEPLSSLEFLHSKSILVALCHCRINVFLVKVSLEYGFEVLGTLKLNDAIHNFIRVVSDDGQSRCLALMKEKEKNLPLDYGVGKLFQVIKYPRMVIEKSWYSETFYESIITGTGIGEILALPADKRDEIHHFFISFKKAGSWEFLGAIQVCHQVGRFQIQLIEKHLITSGWDGLISCYEAEELLDEGRVAYCLLAPHHRADGGIVHATADYKGHYVITRGRDGLIVCSRLKLKNRCSHSFHDPRKHLILNKSPFGTELRHTKLEEAWEDYNKRKVLEGEVIFAEQIIYKIKVEFNEIKREWHIIFAENENESDPEMQLLPTAFELNKPKIDHLMVCSENEVTEAVCLFENMLHLNRGWIQRWKELLADLMPQSLLKIKPFVGTYFIENFNLSYKPVRYRNRMNLMKVISELDGTLFPLTDPSIFPWLPLDGDQEFSEFKMQKWLLPLEGMGDGEEGGGEEEPGEREGGEGDRSEVAEPSQPTGTNSETSHHRNQEKEEGLRTEGLETVAGYQDQVQAALRTDMRSEKEKMIFKELQAVRATYNERKLRLKYKEEGQGLPYDEWKKKYLFGKKDDVYETEELTEPVSALEKNIFEDDPKAAFDQHEGKLEGGEAIPSEDVMEEEGIVKQGEEEEIKGDEITELTEASEEPDSKDSGVGEGTDILEKEVEVEKREEGSEETDSAGFSWSEIQLGTGGGGRPGEETGTELPQGPAEAKTPKQRRITQLLEFGDLKKKSARQEVGYVDPLDEPLSMKGAQSLRFVDADYGRCNELTLNGLFMAEVQVSSLEEVVDELENEFNESFKNALERKTKDIARIKKKTSALLKNIDDLVNVCKGELTVEVIPSYDWTRFELLPNFIWSDEEIVIPGPVNVREFLESERKKESGAAPAGDAGSVSGDRPSYTRLPSSGEVIRLRSSRRKLTRSVLGEEKGTPGGQEGTTSGETALEDVGDAKEAAEMRRGTELRQSLDRMMGGVFQLTWQEKLRQEIYLPSMLLEKDPDSLTPEDVKVIEKYYTDKAKREKLLEEYKKQAEEEVGKLLNEIEEIVYKHDTDLLDLMKKRAVSESCVQSELLKISRLKQKRLIADRTLKNIYHVKDLLSDFHNEGKKLSVMSKIFLKKVAVLQNELEKHQGALKSVENDFFNEVEQFKLTKKSLELLRICFKKKPTGLESCMGGSEPWLGVCHPSELLVLAKSLLETKKCLSYTSASSQDFLTALEELDSPRHCPSHVSHSVWAVLTHHRRLKLVSELKTRALQMLLNDAERTATSYYKHFVAHLERYDQMKRHIRDQKIRLEHHCRKIEILLPEGLIESHHTGNIKDFADCVYISRSHIDNLNSEIVELQKLKEKKWNDFDNYMLVVNSAELLHKELRLRLRIKENILTDINTAKINKYTKEFLSDYQRKQKPNYSVNLRDQKKQEKVKNMVAQYFQTYYSAIKSIKDAKAARERWYDETTALAVKNHKLTAENQELFAAFEELNKSSDNREERNKAIILHGKLVRNYEGNAKKIEELENELHKLYLKNYPTFSVR